MDYCAVAIKRITFKMWIVKLIVITASLLAPTTHCDVVHFLPHPPVLLDPAQAFSAFSYLDTESHTNNNWQSFADTPAPSSYPPVSVETTTRFSLPEIIINKSGGGGGVGYHSEVANNHNGGDSVVVHNQYLPPTPVTTSTTTTTTKRPLFQDELNYYLPPTSPPTSDRNPNNGRYFYPRPPIQFDEPFIEPIFAPPVTPPPNLYLPPPSSPPLNAYLPPVSTAKTSANRTDNDFFGFSTAATRSPLRLEMSDMKCLNNGEDGFFRTRITVQSFVNTLPVFEDSLGCHHRLQVSRNEIVIQIPADEFKSCGVTNCGEGHQELCMRIRFPQIRGMRTVNDAILALQCRPQERVVTKTHAFKMGVSNDNQARSIGAVAQGGGNSKFRTQVGIFRRNGDSFHRPLDANGVVQLGEDLMLRMQTKQGDGWNYTKITDISMQRLGSAGEVLNTASLVSHNGCLNPSMRSICTVPPQYEPPLGQRFGFRAVMFQGMKSGDEVVMSIRISGCVSKSDCDTTTHCGLLKNGGRIRRNAKKDEGEDHVEITKISFRVADPLEKEREANEWQSRSLIITWSCVGIALGFLGVIIFSLMIIYHVRNKVQQEL